MIHCLSGVYDIMPYFRERERERERERILKITFIPYHYNMSMKTYHYQTAKTNNSNDTYFLYFIRLYGKKYFSNKVEITKLVNVTATTGLNTR